MFEAPIHSDIHCHAINHRSKQRRDRSPT